MTALTGTRRSLEDLIAEAAGRVVVLAMSKDPNGKATLLLFAPGSTLPSRVAKVPSTDRAVRSIEPEARRLGDLDRTRLGALSATIPEIRTIASHRGRPVLVTSWMPGRVMLASYHTWRHTARKSLVGADFDAAGTWLAEFQRRTADGWCSLAEMVERFPSVVAAVAPGADVWLFGHVGDGNVHVNPLIDVRRSDWRERGGRILESTGDLVASLGGTLSGEHGDGRPRGTFHDRILGKAFAGALRSVKSRLDPGGIMNPGVIVALPGQDPLEGLSPLGGRR